MWQYKDKLIFFVLIILGISGCAGAIRSDNVGQLVAKEKTGFEKINESLKGLNANISETMKDLKESHKLYVNNLKLWEQEVKRAQIFASSPGDLQNKPVRKAVFTQFAQVELDRYDAYENLQQNFETQTDTLLDAYNKILAASDKLQKQIDVLDTYVNKSDFTFALESIDMETISTALSEFEEGKLLLEKAAEAGEILEKSLKHADIVDFNPQMRQLSETLSLISSRLEELKK